MCVSRHEVRHMRFLNVILFERKSTCSDSLLWQFPSKCVLCQCVFASCFMETLHIVPSFLPRSTCTNLFAKPRFDYQPIHFFRRRMWSSSRSHMFNSWSHKPLLAHHMLRRSIKQPYKHLPSQPPSFAKWCCKLRFHFTQGHVSIWAKWPAAVQIPNWHSHHKTFINIEKRAHESVAPFWHSRILKGP